MTSQSKHVVLLPELAQKILDGINCVPILYISSIAGSGKTTVIKKLLEKRTYTYLPLAQTLTLDVPPHADLVVIDDLHILFFHPDLQANLRSLLENAPATQHFVLLSRGILPDYLLSLAISGRLMQLAASDFAFDIDCLSRMLRTYSLTLDTPDLQRILLSTKGYPALIHLICLSIAEDGALTEDTISRSVRRMYIYLDEILYQHWPKDVRRLLLSVSLFEDFTPELANVLLGSEDAMQIISCIQSISGFLSEQSNTFSFCFPRLREYLQHKAQQVWGQSVIRALYLLSGQWYERQNQLRQAMNSYLQADDHLSLVRVLTENARQHPGIGAYDKTYKYYSKLTEEEILSSPELISAKSMLCSLDLNPDRSEYWYQQLSKQLLIANRGSSAYKNVRSWLTYLDIALPHRGIKGLDLLVPAAYKLMHEQNITLPEFSVTSNLPSILNGGKDFSPWVPQAELLYRTIFRPATDVLGQTGVGLFEVALAESQYEQGKDITNRFVSLIALTPVLRQRGTPETEFVLLSLQARVLCDHNQLESATHRITTFRQRMEYTGVTRLLPNLDALLCRLNLLENGAYSNIWYKEYAPDESYFFPLNRYRYLTKVRCYLNRNEPVQALTLLAHLLDYFSRYHRTLDELDALILLAICRFRMGGDDWSDYLIRALTSAQRYGYVTVFAEKGVALLPLLSKITWQNDPDYFQKISKATQLNATHYPHYLSGHINTIPTLNNMERKVLRLICQNKSNKDICDILSISKNTLKTHIRHLFSKLNAKDRNNAREIAHRLLLEP